jgi:hypothetical protein
MTTTVWKYQIQRLPGQVIDMPGNAEPIHVAIQGGELTLWARVDPNEPVRARVVAVTGTGGNAPSEWLHVGTVFDGDFVWHVWLRP